MAGLSIAPAAGQQTTTQNPQTVPTQTIGAPAQSGGVQPGTATSLLNSQQGVNLSGQTLTTVSLVDTGTRTQASAGAPVKPASHHVNLVWLSVPVILCLVAAGLFWAMTRSAKTTTN